MGCCCVFHVPPSSAMFIKRASINESSCNLIRRRNPQNIGADDSMRHIWITMFCLFDAFAVLFLLLLLFIRLFIFLFAYLFRPNPFADTCIPFCSVYLLLFSLFLLFVCLLVCCDLISLTQMHASGALLGQWWRNGSNNVWVSG